jgi:hypothetical protein
MAGDHEQARIDPRLIERFALFREPGPGPDGPLDTGETERVEQLRQTVLSGRIPPLTAKGLVFDQVRKVALSPTRIMLAIPGHTGIHVVVRSSEQNASYGSGAKIAGRIQGLPIMSIGPNLIGLAVDGVEQQRVEFRDGAFGCARVRHNTYCIEDPSWVRDETALPTRRF